MRNFPEKKVYEFNLGHKHFYCHKIEAKIWACLSRASAVQVPKSQKSEFAAPKS